MLRISALCLIPALCLILGSCVDKTNEQVYHHKDRIIIIWCPTDKEADDALLKYTEEEKDVMESDHTHYITSAMSYINNKGEKFIEDTASSIGFIYKQDTMILNKKDEHKEKGFWWKIILFDGQSKPAVVTAMDFADDNMSWFFKETKSSLVDSIQNADSFGKNDHSEFHLKYFYPENIHASKIGNFGESVVLDIWKTDTLIYRILQQNENNSLKCVEVGDDCVDCKSCMLKTDSIFVDFLDKPDGRYIEYARIQATNVPMFKGRVKIGMTWKEFLVAAETDVEYHEAKYIRGFLESSEVFFYFVKGILREVIDSSTI